MDDDGCCLLLLLGCHRRIPGILFILPCWIDGQTDGCDVCRPLDGCLYRLNIPTHCFWLKFRGGSKLVLRQWSNLMEEILKG
jgi:hypothetical protein